MNDLATRRLYISDEQWKRTSPSWKKMKPLRDFNSSNENDETVEACCRRLKSIFNIPLEVVDQWLFGLYYNVNTVDNYGWIDYYNVSFKKTTIGVEDVASLNVISNYKDYVKSRECVEPFEEFACKPIDKEYWAQNQT
jgi:hypothetical protein